MRTGAAVLLLLILGSALPCAQAEDDSTEPLQLKSEVPLETLLRRVSPLLDAPIVWNPDDRRLRRTQIIGSLRLAFRNIERSERAATVRAFLRFYEFELVRCEPLEQPVYVVVAAPAPRGQWKAEPLRLDRSALQAAAQRSGRLVATTLSLNAAPKAAKDVTQAARRLLANSPRAFAEYVPETRSLLLRGDAPRVAAVVQLLISAGLVDEGSLDR